MLPLQRKSKSIVHMKSFLLILNKNSGEETAGKNQKSAEDDKKSFNSTIYIKTTIFIERRQAEQTRDFSYNLKHILEYFRAAPF